MINNTTVPSMKKIKRSVHKIIHRQSVKLVQQTHLHYVTFLGNNSFDKNIIISISHFLSCNIIVSYMSYKINYSRDYWIFTVLDLPAALVGF